MEGGAEQIPVSNQDTARISPGFVLRTICIIIRPAIMCVPGHRRLHTSLVCDLFFQSSDTEISNVLEDFCSANEPCFASAFSHLPSNNFALSIFSHSQEKTTQLFPCFAVEVQSPRYDLLL